MAKRPYEEWKFKAHFINLIIISQKRNEKSLWLQLLMLSIHLLCSLHRTWSQARGPQSHCSTDSCVPDSLTPVTHELHHFHFLLSTSLTRLVSHNMQPPGDTVLPRRVTASVISESAKKQPNPVSSQRIT